MLSWKALILVRVGLFVMVAILGMSSGLTGRSAKISAGFMIFLKLMMALRHGRLNIVGAFEKYNQQLKPK